MPYNLMPGSLKHCLVLLTTLAFPSLLQAEGGVIVEILGGTGEATGPAVELFQDSGYQYYLLEDYLQTTDPAIQQVQLLQYFRGFDPRITSTSQRFAFMVTGGDFIEIGSSVQASQFKAKNLYPRSLSPLVATPVPFYSPSWIQNPIRDLARTDLNSALYLYNLREEQSLDSASFLAADIRLLLPLGPADVYVTGSLPLSEDAGNSRVAFAAGFRIKIISGFRLYAEAHRTYARVSWKDRLGDSYSDLVYDNGVRFGFGVGAFD